MVFGFGFNKAKIQASAEKNVKQGKLHAAIADYEKISREDPKDLNILNTIGDLYARLGNTEQATNYFKRVGDAYASEGFTVKAIAMYKKLTKQNPTATPAIQKLAELYTQQGLFTDARAQYMLLVDQHLRSGDADSAAAVLQKVLDLDPENPNLQSRLAELYVRLGKKTEARDIYFRSAQALRSRGNLAGCDLALDHVLQLDPAYSQAAMLRGQVKLDSGDAKGAVQVLEQIPDIDSRAEGLRLLLRARLGLGQVAEAEPLAKKLLSVFNDPTGLATYAEALISTGAFEQTVQLFKEQAEGLMRANVETFVENLGKLTGRVKNNPRSLEVLGELFQRAGNTTHLAEVTELLAHAYVQEGALEKARDLYQKLADMEPENPLHAQNYRQIVARMGDDSAARELTPEQGAKAFLVEELEQAAPIIDQEYPADIAAAVRDALTDAELFASYNLPARAIPALEAVLPRAPQDVQINQRLASLYVRMARWADAVRCCDVLATVLTEAGHAQEGREYRDMAARYRKHAGLPAESEPASREQSLQPVAGLPQPAAVPDIHAAATPVTPEPAAAPPPPEGDAISHEIDLSEEWERVMTVELPSAPVEEAPALAEAEQPARAAGDAALGDLVEEVRFYLAQEMWTEARAALARARDRTPGAAVLDELEAALANAPVAEPTPVETPVPGEELAPAEFAVAAPGPPVIEAPAAVVVPPPAPVPQGPEAEVAPAAHAEPAPVEPEAPQPLEEVVPSVIEALDTLPAEPGPEPPAELAPVAAAPEAEPFAIAPPPTPGPTLPERIPEPVVPAAPPPFPAPPLQELSPVPPPDTTTALPDVSTAVPAETLPESLELPEVLPNPVGTQASEDVLADFALDLEESLGDDFGQAPSPPAPVTVGPPVYAAPQAPAPISPSMTAGAVAPASAPVAQSAGIELIADELTGQSASPLADLFAEFKQDVESGAHDAEDPETHYNLGVAFKEMGLLDEAIGELQKVCHAIEHGHSFPQVIEAYTWLADCFLQKGVPEAAIHWYEKALRVSGLGDERSLAIHYEIACAQEAAGNLIAARQHFMHVLSVNIDYRDVAERIKALRS
ncbi:MAG: tetratricopeptide repeat protein [Terriglobales bacterium]